MSKLKVAIIGCGTIASSQHIEAYEKSGIAEIKYLVDIRKEHAEALAKKHGIPHVVTDFREILADEELSAVSVCTPNDTHAPISIACLEAGKHVLCEKPAAPDIESVYRMQEAANATNCVLNIGVVNRYNTAVNKIKQLLEDGELGNLYHVYCSFRAHRSIPGLGGPFTTKAKAGGGVLIDWGVHFLDLIFYIAGGPKVHTVSGAVHSEMAKKLEDYTYVDMWAGPPRLDGVYDVEDFVTGLIRTSGPTINLNGAWAQNIGESAMFVEFLGDKGGVKWEYGGEFTLYTANKGTLYESKPSYTRLNMFHEEIKGFLSAVQDRQQGRTPADDRASIQQVCITSEVMDALYRSAASGKEVQL